MHDSHSAPKSRYHFRVFNNGEQHHESDALAFDDLDEVWQEGAMTSCELIRTLYGRINSDLHWRLDVSDDSGAVIYRFSYRAEKLGRAGNIAAMPGIPRQDILRHAENCLKVAAALPEQESRTLLREMAAAWLRLADGDID